LNLPGFIALAPMGAEARHGHNLVLLGSVHRWMLRRGQERRQVLRQECASGREEDEGVGAKAAKVLVHRRVRW
ncbi:unnamed protein product, partial [Ilex paraguariensis]